MSELETLAAPAEVRKLPPQYETASLGEAELPPAAGDTAADTQTLPDETPPSAVGEAARVVRRTTRRVADVNLAGDELREGPRRIDRYELREVLGEGGCGTVYAAWDPRHEREVALKLMFRGDERARQRFARPDDGEEVAQICKACGGVHCALRRPDHVLSGQGRAVRPDKVRPQRESPAAGVFAAPGQGQARSQPA